MKIESKIVIFKLAKDVAGMPIYVGRFNAPDFITSTSPPFGDTYDYKVENVLAENDMEPDGEHYKIRLNQACVLT